MRALYVSMRGVCVRYVCVCVCARYSVHESDIQRSSEGFDNLKSRVCLCGM